MRMAYRVETAHTVTASNLFKYCEPCHGLVLFKHHHPLHFSRQQVSELLNTASEWFRASHALHPEACYPFFLWNCLPRAGLVPSFEYVLTTLYAMCGKSPTHSVIVCAGASQFHGHAQVMLSQVLNTAHLLSLRHLQILCCTIASCSPASSSLVHPGSRH